MSKECNFPFLYSFKQVSFCACRLRHPLICSFSVHEIIRSSNLRHSISKAFIYSCPRCFSQGPALTSIAYMTTGHTKAFINFTFVAIVTPWFQFHHILSVVWLLHILLLVVIVTPYYILHSWWFQGMSTCSKTLLQHLTTTLHRMWPVVVVTFVLSALSTPTYFAMLALSSLSPRQCMQKIQAIN